MSKYSRTLVHYTQDIETRKRFNKTREIQKCKGIFKILVERLKLVFIFGRP